MINDLLKGITNKIDLTKTVTEVIILILFFPHYFIIFLF
jgi:hypothetical protein